MTSLISELREKRKNILDIIISSQKLSEFILTNTTYPVNNLKIIEYPQKNIKELEPEKLKISTINLLSYNNDTDIVEFIDVDTGLFNRVLLLELYDVSVINTISLNQIQINKNRILEILEKYNILLTLIYRKEKYLNLTESELDNLILKLQQ
ncbi:MAG: hypothetical protein QXW48_01400 [Thermoplasmata archaeon]